MKDALRAVLAVRSTSSVRRENGAAMLMALIALSLLTAFGVAMLLTSSSEVRIAGTFRDQRSAIYAADAIVARAADELIGAPDWNALLDGSLTSTLVDGPPTGMRTLPDGAIIDLVQIVNMANCEKRTTCAVSDLSAVTAHRPWGTNNPRWQLYAYGPLHNMLPDGAVDSPWYLLLLVGDDPLKAADVIALRAEAFGPRSGHAAIELMAARTPTADSDYNGGGGEATLRILSWREVR
jgi:hypothetical protein